MRRSEMGERSTGCLCDLRGSHPPFFLLKAVSGSSTLDLLGRIVLGCGAALDCSRALMSVPGLYRLDECQVTTKNDSRCCQNVLGGARE